MIGRGLLSTHICVYFLYAVFFDKNWGGGSKVVGGVHTFHCLMPQRVFFFGGGGGGAVFQFFSLQKC